jgi:hypothetical protein
MGISTLRNFKTTQMETITKQMSFYATGESFTNLVRNFIEEGNFLKAYAILKQGGMTDEHVKKFIERRMVFEGDTRVGDHTLSLVEVAEPTSLSASLEHGRWLNEMILTALRTMWKTNGDYVYNWNSFSEATRREMEVLYKVGYTKDELVKMILPAILRVEGYKIAQPSDEPSDGVILRDGTFVACGYQEHRDLFPLLKSLNLSECSDWMEENWVIHVSSGMMNGHVANAIDNPDIYPAVQVTEAQLKSLFAFRHSVTGMYGSYEDKTVELLRRRVEFFEDHGGKFNNLTFLKKYYNVSVPMFSKHRLPDLGFAQCIRTSPKKSLPGLLNSKFDLTDDSIKEIEADFEKVKDLRGDNELHYFYQQFLEGVNGVCHRRGKKGEFSYSVSAKQGDVVKGVESNEKLDAKHESRLREISKELFDDLGRSVQLEFVVSDDQLYIVQLRLLEREPDETVILTEPSDALCYGLTFSRGNETVNVKDILVVDQDADSSELLGKKALLVRNKVEFSHILALSKALGIPSMYGVGDVKLPSTGKVKFTAFNKTAWITV